MRLVYVVKPTVLTDWHLTKLGPTLLHLEDRGAILLNNCNSKGWLPGP